MPRTTRLSSTESTKSNRDGNRLTRLPRQCSRQSTQMYKVDLDDTLEIDNFVATAPLLEESPTGTTKLAATLEGVSIDKTPKKTRARKAPVKSQKTPKRNASNDSAKSTGRPVRRRTPSRKAAEAISYAEMDEKVDIFSSPIKTRQAPPSVEIVEPKSKQTPRARPGAKRNLATALGSKPSPKPAGRPKGSTKAKNSILTNKVENNNAPAETGDKENIDPTALGFAVAVRARKPGSRKKEHNPEVLETHATVLAARAVMQNLPTVTDETRKNVHITTIQGSHMVPEIQMNPSQQSAKRGATLAGSATAAPFIFSDNSTNSTSASRSTRTKTTGPRQSQQQRNKPNNNKKKTTSTATSAAATQPLEASADKAPPSVFNLLQENADAAGSKYGGSESHASGTPYQSEEETSSSDTDGGEVEDDADYMYTSPIRKKKDRTLQKTPRKKSSSSSAAKRAAFKTPKKSEIDDITARKRLVKTPRPTRYSLRNAQEVFDDLDDDSEQGSSKHSSSESDSSESDGGEGEKAQTGTRKRHIEEDLETIDTHETDAYFMAMHKSIKTSKNTLADLEYEIDAHEISKRSTFPDEKSKIRFEELYVHNSKKFKDLLYYLSHGFSILCYGLGSKFNLLQDFKDRHLQDFHVLEISAFNTQQRLTGRGLLENILIEMLEVTRSIPRSPHDQRALLDEYFSENRANSKNVAWEEVFILVHNIEFIASVRGSQDSYICALPGCHNTLGVLATLASYPRVHLIASIDNVNGAMCFNSQAHAAFKFVGLDMTNPLSEYCLEIRAQGYGRDHTDKQVLMSGILNIYKSLTQNAQKIFQILINYQIDESEGIDVDDLYQKCRQKFLANSRMTLDQQLVEFHDHKLLSIQRKDGQADKVLLHISTETMLNVKSELAF